MDIIMDNKMKRGNQEGYGIEELVRVEFRILSQT